METKKPRRRNPKTIRKAELEQILMREKQERFAAEEQLRKARKDETTWKAVSWFALAAAALEFAFIVWKSIP